MKFTALQATALLVLSSLSPLSAAPSPAPAPAPIQENGKNDNMAHCERQNSVVALGYTILAPDVPADYVPDLCRILYRKLRRFKHSCYISSNSCKVDGTGLQWKFWVPVGCNQGMVQSAWWEATKNDYGGVKCPGWG